MAKRGRPTKLTDELQQQFCDLIAKKGLHRKHAAAAVGLPERTIASWYHRGARDENGTFRGFYLAVDKAEADFAATCLEMLQARGSHDPKIVQWILSRRFPELFGRKDNVEEKSPEDRAAQAQATRQLLFERLERLRPEEPKPEETKLEVIPGGKPNAVA